MTTGTVKYFNEEKFFGFIKSEGAGDVFFHISEINGDDVMIERGQKLGFEISQSDRGPRAYNIVKL